MKKGLHFCLSSPPDRKKLVIEFFFDNKQWAELNQENNKLTLEIYPGHSSKPWQFDFKEVLKILNDAKNRLNIKDK